MPFHHTTGTIAVSKWCNKCRRFTMHQVSRHREGRCTEHSAPELTIEQQRRRDRADRERRQPRLF